ncbi:hypothetical protein BH09ACT4_BH09ACT4_22000 [soil metagenome]
MTTATLDQAHAATTFGRIARVVKLNLANPFTTIVLPWIVITLIFVTSWLIWLIVFSSVAKSDLDNVSEGMQFSGASSWIFVYMLVVAVQAMNLTFPLALGYGSTRRDFYLGSALTFVLMSAMWAVGLTILAVIETATHGWGVGGRMFTALYFGSGALTVWQQLIVFFCISLFFYFLGAAIASGYVRWKQLGLLLFFGITGLVGIGAVALLTYNDNWPAVGQFFVTYQAVGVSLWLLVPTAIAGIVGFFVLRRATPRS